MEHKQYSIVCGFLGVTTALPARISPLRLPTSARGIIARGLSGCARYRSGPSRKMRNRRRNPVRLMDMWRFPLDRLPSLTENMKLA